ncbi:MAG: F0F1 ATP synthase subunit A [Chloroflexi bacterium]|nr:F0F1 ATP synthase subunit A [Chloroflexota bacterium]
MARLRVAGIVIGALVLMGFGLLFLGAPKPHIEIKAEPLWTIGFFEITNTLFTAWLATAVLFLIAIFATRKMSFIPSGLQNIMEAIVEMLLTLVENTVGPKHARRFFPVIATIFLFIVVGNWMALLPVFNVIGKIEPVGVEEEEFFEEVIIFEDRGIFMVMPNTSEIEIHFDEAVCDGVAEGHEHEACLEEGRALAIAQAREDEGIDPDAQIGILAPYFRSMNTDLMTPLSLAIVAAIFVEWWGISALGLVGYGKRFFSFGRLAKGDPMGIIDIFVGILELIAEFARLISFTFRLFGNMLAGEILLLVMTFLIPLVLALPFYGLELFVGAIQAFVFAMLTLVFGALAVTSHDDHDEEEAHASGGEVAAAQQAE